ncbi:hypothetical protein GCM10023063_43190 [Arthrobacter methylotrophus]|uniref:Uncharacterized protein n=1 Tax=Arthrobacter methylotrophus TaxID=121291 RepID=A0ABV5URC2_9MICC
MSETTPTETAISPEQTAVEPQPAGTPTPDHRDLDNQTWTRTRFDITLAPAKI